MSYVNARESRGAMAIASDEFDDAGRGGRGATKPPGQRIEPLTVEPVGPVHPGGFVVPQVIRKPLPRIQLPIRANQVSFSPSGPTRPTSLFPNAGYLPQATVIIGPNPKGGMVSVRPRAPGAAAVPGSPPILSVPIDPGSLVRPKLPEIVMTQPGPTGPAPIINASTGGGPSPSSFPGRPKRPVSFPGVSPELETIDIRDLVTTAPAPAGMSRNTKIKLAVAGVAAVGLLYYMTRRKTKP
jgi:hypothetical protein